MAADSLILAGTELLGQVTEFSLVKDTFDLGVAQPDQATISSLLLDGDVQSGDRTGNRQVSLTLLVRATSRSDMTAQIDALLLAVNVRSGLTFPLQWTPSGGLTIVFDCQRATAQRPQSIVRDNQLVSYVTLTFQASPFGRSPTQQSVTVAAKSQVDSFDTAPTGAALDTTTKIEGTGSAKVTGSPVGGHPNSFVPAASVSRTFTARDYSAFPNMVLQALVANPTVDSVNLSVTLTLASTSGSTRYPAVSALFGVLYGKTASVFQTVTIPLAGGVVASGTGVTLTAVTSYSISSQATRSDTPASTNWWFDDLEATGSSAALASTTRGELLLVPNVIGSARTPVSLAAVGTINALLVHRPPSDQDSNAQILTGVTIAASPSHPAATTIAANNAHFKGTYSAVLGVSANGAAGSNTVTVIITQLENGASVATQTLAATYTSPQGDRLVKLGDVTLPLRAVPADNTTTTYTIDINHSVGADTYSDFMLLDTRGQTVIADPASAVAAVYLDAPTSLLELGAVYASAAGNRTDAYCIDDTTFATGGPVLFDPGNNRMLIWSDTATPTLTVTYYPRWLDERVA